MEEFVAAIESKRSRQEGTKLCFWSRADVGKYVIDGHARALVIKGTQRCKAFFARRRSVALPVSLFKLSTPKHKI